ncbi:hypothetical protein NHQ30_001150 [Ciborinia camelliae]|nr:hypothetical protein NHQ30_001150 [Ciborinia camelliae]
MSNQSNDNISDTDTSEEFRHFERFAQELQCLVWRALIENSMCPPRAILSEFGPGLPRPPRELPFMESSTVAREEALLRIPDLTCYPRVRRHLGNYFGSTPSTTTHDWLSMEHDIFVLIHTYRIGVEFSTNPLVQQHVQRIAIPAKHLDLPRDVQERRFMWQHQWMQAHRSLRTVIFLRDDPAQEPLSHNLLINFGYRYHRTNDMRIIIDAEPVSQEYLDSLGFDVQWRENHILAMQFFQRGWQFPEIRWGCLVRL